MTKGVGTIISETLETFGISKSGCGCSDLANELNKLSPEEIETNLDNFVVKFRSSISKWRKNNTKLVPAPPDFVLRRFLLYAISKSRGEG